MLVVVEDVTVMVVVPSVPLRGVLDSSSLEFAPWMRTYTYTVLVVTVVVSVSVGTAQVLQSVKSGPP